MSVETPAGGREVVTGLVGAEFASGARPASLHSFIAGRPVEGRGNAIERVSPATGETLFTANELDERSACERAPLEFFSELGAASLACEP